MEVDLNMISMVFVVKVCLVCWEDIISRCNIDIE